MLKQHKFNSTRVYVQVLHLVLDTVVMIGRIWMKGQLTSVARERWKEDPTESYLKALKATSEPLLETGKAFQDLYQRVWRP